MERDEIATVLVELNDIGYEDAAQIASELVINLDANDDGRLSMDEFANEYIELIKKLRLRQTDLEDQMLEHYEQYKFNKKKLEDVNKTPPTQFQKRVQFDIIEVRNVPNQVYAPQVKVFLDTVIDGIAVTNLVGETPPKNADLPVYNHLLQIPIQREEDSIVFVVFNDNQQVQPPLERRVAIKQLRQWMEDINLPVKELWFPFDIAGRAQNVLQESGQDP